MTTCCPSGEFNFFSGGVQIKEPNVQADSCTIRFITWKSIQAVEYYYSKSDREGLLGLYLRSGLNYQWTFPCEAAGKNAYEEIISRLNA